MSEFNVLFEIGSAVREQVEASEPLEDVSSALVDATAGVRVLDFGFAPQPTAARPTGRLELVTDLGVTVTHEGAAVWVRV